MQHYIFCMIIAAMVSCILYQNTRGVRPRH